VAAVVAVQRRAAGARVALVAGRRAVAKVRATRPLEEGPADGGHGAQLPRGAGQERLGEERISARYRAAVGASHVPQRRAGALGAICARGRPCTGRRTAGVMTWSCRRSTSVVPPARYSASSCPEAAATAAASSATLR